MNDKITLANYIAKFPFVLFYQGDYKKSPTLHIINIVEKHFEPLIKKTSLKTLVYLLIEALQNIERYSAHISSSEDFAFVYSDDRFFHIITQNMINNTKINDLTSRLNTISIKNKEELDETYKFVLKSDIRTEKGGGLGLIDIARKSKNQLYYSFDTKTETHSAYTLGFSVPIDKADSEVPNDNYNTASLINHFKTHYKLNNSTLFYSGDFSNHFILALFELLKNNATTTINTTSQHLLIELIQNVKKHAHLINSSSSGQISLEWNNQELKITTYNLLNDQQGEKITKKLTLLNAASNVELQEISKKQLLDFTQSDGLGLIDIALLIFPRKILYQVNKKSNFVSELILTITTNYD